jgi:hypothetical protein
MRSHLTTMFYFDVRDGGQLVSDEEGQQLSSLDAAVQEAAEAAAAIARDVLPSRRGGEVVVEVRNEDRNHVLTVSVEMYVTTIRTGSER